MLNLKKNVDLNIHFSFPIDIDILTQIKHFLESNQIKDKLLIIDKSLSLFSFVCFGHPTIKAHNLYLKYITIYDLKDVRLIIIDTTV